MKRRTFVGSTLALGAGLAVPGCSAFEPSETLRFRITVEVDTPQGVRSGYSVWEYKVTDIKIGFSSLETDWRGEAVAVDLPGGHTLFALLVSGDGSPEYPEWVILEHYRKTPEYKADGPRAFLTVFPDWRNGRESWTVPPVLPPIAQTDPPRSGYPMLVIFRDAADLTSVVKVDPNDLEASFGLGVRLKQITVDVTDDPVTTGIEMRLRWLDQYYDKHFDGRRIGDGTNLANDLAAGAFSTELNP
jgi:hypothetical protein